jgi:outer membrane biosynthesis protein TonB
MFEMRRIVPLLLLVLLASGGVAARAKTLPTGPPLDVPPPPPRIVLPVETQAEAPPTPEAIPVPDEPRRPSTSARPRPAPPVEAPKIAEEPPKAPPATAPATAPAATTLQITPAAEQGEVERAIRASMAKAGADLNKVDYRALNANARTQYDTAKRFIQQAEDAIRMKNLPFAKNLADKAAALAIQLGGQ